MKHEGGTRGRMTALVLIALAAAGDASAAGCTVSSSGLAFGAYQPLSFSGKLASAAVTSNATVSIVCTGIASGSDYAIALGPSAVGSGDRIGTRYMANTLGGNPMAFNLYRDAGVSSPIWGDGLTAGSVLLAGSIPVGSSNHSHVVYGNIPAGQFTLSAGSFSASLTITLTYNP
jgi:spore coat protein U-like protein